jgi:hypothetical protein
LINQDATAIETTKMHLTINIYEGLANLRYLSGISLRINSEVVEIFREAFGHLIRFASIPDFETVNNLLSRPSVLYAFPMLLRRVHEFLETIGLHRGEDFQCEVSEWIDYEVEGWNHLQLKVTLLKSGRNKLFERGMDKFTLLKNLITMASQILPHEVRQEVIVLVE